MISGPDFGRLKRAIRTAISLNGGIDGAAATAGKSHTLAGNWHNLNQADTPVLVDAIALDEIAVSQGKAPPILAAYAAVLGHVAIRLPDPGCAGDALTGALIEASAEFGDVAGAVRDATRSGQVGPKDRDNIIQQIDEAHAALAKLRAVVTAEEAAQVAKLKAA